MIARQHSLALNAFRFRIQKSNFVLEKDGKLQWFLVVSIISGHENIIKYLMERGASINMTTDMGETTLHCAARNGMELLTLQKCKF